MDKEDPLGTKGRRPHEVVADGKVKEEKRGQDKDKVDRRDSRLNHRNTRVGKVRQP
jgi:hypothetical protein